jgi:hypothetical protein
VILIYLISGSGNFAGSCENITYSDNGDLKALCRNGVKGDSDNWVTINLSMVPPLLAVAIAYIVV